MAELAVVVVVVVDTVLVVLEVELDPAVVCS